MVCTLDPLATKELAGAFSKSEPEFFGGVRNLKRNYLKTLFRLEHLPDER